MTQPKEAALSALFLDDFIDPGQEINVPVTSQFADKTVQLQRGPCLQSALTADEFLIQTIQLSEKGTSRHTKVYFSNRSGIQKVSISQGTLEMVIPEHYMHSLGHSIISTVLQTLKTRLLSRYR